ncbi:MAG: PA2778 family cysteine peptidase [Desulfohalobiaceae bacterium]|nr:PA2778 family cysteine peptidase [Desulfohalobiaceae bacterium]
MPGCALKGVDPAFFSSPELPAARRLVSVPFFAQDRLQCGPASLASVLSWSGVEAAPLELKQEVYTPGRKGSLQPDLKTAARRRGRLAYEISGLRELLQEVAAGHPVIVLQNLGLAWFPKWHYAVAVGYDLNKGQIFLHSGLKEAVSRTLGLFAKTWKRSGYWGLVVLKPGNLPATAEQKRYLRAVLGLEQAGRLQAAVKGYEAALSRWPDSQTAAVGRGNCLYGLGDPEAAADAFQQAAAVHPRSPEIYNNLAQTLLDLGRIKEALTAAQTAVGLGGPHREIFEQTVQEIQAAKARSE